MRHRWAWALQARLRRAQQAVAFHRAWLDALDEEIAATESMLSTETGDEEPFYSAGGTYRERARSAPVSRPRRRPEEARPERSEELSEDARRDLYFAIFDEMRGHDEEFLEDGRPRVENVNSRLSERIQDPGATRREIDEVFEVWQQSRNPEGR